MKNKKVAIGAGVAALLLAGGATTLFLTSDKEENKPAVSTDNTKNEAQNQENNTSSTVKKKNGIDKSTLKNLTEIKFEYGQEINLDEEVQIKDEKGNVVTSIPYSKLVPSLDTKKAGETNYKINVQDVEYNLLITVEDTVSPKIEGVKESFTVPVGSDFSKELSKFIFATDPVDGDVRIEYTFTEANAEKTKYDVEAIAKDVNGNETKAEFKLVVEQSGGSSNGGTSNSGTNGNSQNGGNSSSSTGAGNPNKPPSIGLGSAGSAGVPSGNSGSSSSGGTSNPNQIKPGTSFPSGNNPSGNKPSGNNPSGNPSQIKPGDNGNNNSGGGNGNNGGGNNKPGNDIKPGDGETSSTISNAKIPITMGPSKQKGSNTLELIDVNLLDYNNVPIVEAKSEVPGAILIFKMHGRIEYEYNKPSGNIKKIDYVAVIGDAGGGLRVNITGVDQNGKTFNSVLQQGSNIIGFVFSNPDFNSNDTNYLIEVSERFLKAHKE